MNEKKLSRPGSGRAFPLCMALLVLVSWTPAAAQRIATGTLCEVTGDGINLRADSRITAPILGKAHEGDLVKVLREHAGWYKVTPPDSFDAWISSDYVDQGTGRVTGNRVNVRAGPGTKNAVLGQVHDVDRVDVLGAQSGWVRVRAPSTVGVWIHGKFVRPAKEAERERVALQPTPALGDASGRAPGRTAAAEPVALSATGAESPDVIDLVRRADLLFDTADAGGGDYADFSGAHQLYEEARTLARTQGVRHHIELKLSQITLRDELLQERLDAQKHYAGTVAELEAENRRLRQEYEARLAELALELERSTRTQEPEQIQFTAVGWTWPMGKIWRRPGTHRLLMGGKTLYYIKSDTIDLNADELWKEYVGVVGTVREAPGWKHPVIQVEKVVVLDAPR